MQDDFAQRIRRLDSAFTGLLTCPLLEERTGACRVYANRPAMCRMYGSYIARDGNEWCELVQDLYDTGACDGLVLGNAKGPKRDLSQKCGAVKSLVEWFYLI